jgi:nickel/cobalt tolerance cation efflux system protein
VLGGLLTSTALTLLVLPALYARFGRWLLPPVASQP